MSVAVIRKSFSILETIADHPHAISLVDLSNKTKVPKPTALRIVRTLKELGYLAQEAESGAYFIGNSMSRLSNPKTRHLLIEVAKPLMRALYDQFDENVNLGVLEDLSIAYVDFLETTKPLRWIVKQHHVDPCYSTALGRAILAGLPEEEQDQIISRIVFEPKTPQTVTSVEIFRTILAQTQARGWSLEEDETDEGIVCVGMSLAPFGFKYAALSMTIPKPRFNYQIQEQITAAFKTLSKKFPPVSTSAKSKL